LYLDRAGLKGYRIGDAKVSEVHAGFIVNCGRAHARDVLALIDYCKTIVKEKYGVLLQTELETVE
jgi:UDP-N-acetylmuramate dehydrogenase